MTELQLDNMPQVQPATIPQGTTDRQRKRGKRIFHMGIYAFLAFYALITLFPFYIMFIRSFVGTAEASELHLVPPEPREFSENARIGDMASLMGVSLTQFKEDFDIPPTVFIRPSVTIGQMSEQLDIPAEELQDYFASYSVFGGWRKILLGGEFLPALLRTTVVTLISVLLINGLSLLTGYGLAGLRRRDQVIVYNLYLLQLIIPPMLIILPQFLLVRSVWDAIPGYDVSGSSTRMWVQLAILVLLNIKGTAISTMIYTSYISNIPRDLEEAAVVDGAARWQYFLFVLVPLMRVPAASLTVIMLPIFWNDFLQPFIYVDQQNTTILPLIQGFAGEFATDFQASFAALFLSLVPLVLIYLVFRRWFIRGVMSGAIKG